MIDPLDTTGQQDMPVGTDPGKIPGAEPTLSVCLKDEPFRLFLLLIIPKHHCIGAETKLAFRVIAQLGIGIVWIGDFYIYVAQGKQALGTFFCCNQNAC